MCEMPSAFTTTKRKARKHHFCCECGNSIEPGDQYQYSSGIWDGEPQSYKQCCNCHEIMQAALQSDEGRDETPCFQGLREWFNDYQCIDFAEKKWLNGMASKINIEPEKLNRLLRV